jgi:hypothetical protein
MWLVIIMILDGFLHGKSKIMIITSHMQKNYSNLSMFTEVIAKQDTILKIGDFSTKN